MPTLPPGVTAALGAALLFGAGTPLSKQLLAGIDPWVLAGLLYLGSGLGLSLYRLLRRSPPARLAPGQWRWLLGAVVSGGLVGPVLLMYGLARMPASGASLLLNAEAVFTALLAWVVFRENVDRRVALGMACIAAGAIVLSWPRDLQLRALAPTLAVLAACLAWAIDNNLTRKVSLSDAGWIAAVKGSVAGSVNLALGLVAGASLPRPALLAGAMLVGLLAYGVSLALFVVALRQLGTARTGAYFGVAPFFGAMLGVGLLGEPVDGRWWTALLLMAIGVGLHLTERHRHQHTHPAQAHEHVHSHDIHHQHAHAVPVAPGTTHSHWHEHPPLTHDHVHFPDAHHRHPH